MTKSLPVIAFVVLAVSAVACATTASRAQDKPSQQPQVLSIAGVGPLANSGIGTLGIFDPSIADNTATGQRLWMSYSAIAPTLRTQTKNHWLVTLRLAHSDNGGATWQDAGYPIEDAKEFGQGSRASAWNSEVSSLVYDPSAAAAERWKLFWHQYLLVNGVPRFVKDGWIGYKTAATPDGLRSAAEIKLFSGKGYSSVNDSSGGDTASPVAGPPALRISQIHRELECIALTEPGAMATRSGIYLAMSCIEFSFAKRGPAAKIVLMKCAVPCDAARPGAWTYIATLLTESDAAKFGFIKFTGADLFTKGGRAYLIASPVSNRPVKDAYNGCYVFRFANLDTGELEAEDGHPAVLHKILGTPNSFNGACTYVPAAAAAGVLYSQILFRDRPLFQIFQSHQRF